MTMPEDTHEPSTAVRAIFVTLYCDARDTAAQQQNAQSWRHQPSGSSTGAWPTVLELVESDSTARSHGSHVRLRAAPLTLTGGLRRDTCRELNSDADFDGPAPLVSVAFRTRGG